MKKYFLSLFSLICFTAIGMEKQTEEQKTTNLEASTHEHNNTSKIKNKKSSPHKTGNTIKKNTSTKCERFLNEQIKKQKMLPSQKQALQDQKNARLCFKIQKNNPTEGQLYYKATTYLTVWAQNLQLKIESEDPEIQKLQKEINQKNANACQKILTMHNLTGSEISPSCKLFLHNWIEEITEQKQEQIKNNSTIKY